ncbi:MAG: vWA domain-containing protein [Saccharofermentanales bacterium]
MTNKRTELVFILDQSGSMSGLESDTIGGYNAFLKKQAAIDSPCLITTVLFNDRYRLLHDRIDIRAVSPLTDKDYQVGGSTALLDAMGQSINKLMGIQKQTSPDYRADQVLFVIITDGQENSSREYSLDRIKKMVEEQQKADGWEFIFLGANIDAITTAQAFGIGPDRAVDYLSDHEGTQLNYSALDRAIGSFRTSGKLAQEGLDEIRQDVKNRGK